LQQEKELIINLDEVITYNKSRAWGNYVLGVFKALSERDKKLRGAEMVFDSNLPIGSGLSSSSALLTLTVFVLNKVHESGLSRKEMAMVCKEIENDFIGLQSGLMDPVAIALAKQGKLLSFDCASRKHEHLDISMSDYAFLIFDTGKTRQLSDSAYNDRAEACEKALEAINQKKGEQQEWRSLDLGDIQFLSDEILQKRARHVISEMKRVGQAKVFLENNDIKGFGKLMFASHQSLKEDYEVSCDELDLFVDWANGHEKCLGAKMTGAGFGGCAVAIVEKQTAPDLILQIESKYQEETGLKGKAFVTEAGEGVYQL
jgi:galactokinase